MSSVRVQATSANKPHTVQVSTGANTAAQLCYSLSLPKLTPNLKATARSLCVRVVLLATPAARLEEACELRCVRVGLLSQAQALLDAPREGGLCALADLLHSLRAHLLLCTHQLQLALLLAALQLLLSFQELLSTAGAGLRFQPPLNLCLLLLAGTQERVQVGPRLLLQTHNLRLLP